VTDKVILQFKRQLVVQFGLRKTPQERGTSSPEDLYHILFHHWVHDDHVYKDERQRVQVATGILMASFFGCRPTTMFSTKIKFKNDTSRTPAPHEDGAASGDATTVNRDGDEDCSASASSESDSDDDTDDGIYNGSEEARTLLWRHIVFFITPNPVPGMPNIVFAKVTLLHTKGEDRCPRV